MDIRAAYDWGRVSDWLDSDMTTYTIKNAVAFVFVWWLAGGWLAGGWFGTAAVARRSVTSGTGTAVAFHDDGRLCAVRDRNAISGGRSADCDSGVFECAARAA